jgi:hypothetical protein
MSGPTAEVVPMTHSPAAAALVVLVLVFLMLVLTVIRS